jgi:hypothetical protein
MLLVFAVAAMASSGLVVSTTSAAGLDYPLFAPRGAHRPFAGSQQAVCARSRGGEVVGRCLIHVLTPTARPALTITSPTGLSPSTIKTVYGYPTSTTAGTGQTIALVDAYNDPDAASDLSKFSTQYGLPAAKLTQVNQTGGSSLPATESGWDLEISLDIEWAHAIAPGANILLVEATNNDLENLLAAESYASKHASYVSNSWGTEEFPEEGAYDSYFATPGVSYFAAAGDEGGLVSWPSAASAVTSVGGTSLALTAGGTLAQETVWSEGGGGCSLYEPASPSQHTGSVSCAGKRATPDIALDGDPNSGVSVYDSVAYEGQAGWWTVGGTSASTAMSAAQAAVAASLIDPAFLYASPANIPFRDITSGSNGYPALSGYDLATGLGSWSYTPGAPTAVSISREGTHATLAWHAPSGAAVTEYAIWRGTASGAETTLLAKVPAAQSTYKDTTLSEGVTYYYELQAINGAGSGPFSAQALAPPPSKPPVASFTTSCTQATCAFSSTSTDAQGTIDAYAWNGGNGVTGASAHFSDTYKAAGSYKVTLKVTNTAGQSSATASASVTCTATPVKHRPRHTVLTCT